MLQQRIRVLSLIVVLGATVGLVSACAPIEAGPKGPAEQGSGDNGAVDEGGQSPAQGATLKGTGRYAIGSEAPLGGYELAGDVGSQPEGCTWSIEDADGAAAFENQGAFVFLTDIKEAVTFVTNGCPDWVQFE